MEIFHHVPFTEELIVNKKTDEMVLFEPFLIENPPTIECFPGDDEPFYTSLEFSLRHLLYKYDKGWITSEREVIYSTNECISTIHFLFDENNEVSKINVFQRSSNIKNLYDDVQFFNYFIFKYLKKEKVDLNIFVSAPHIFNGKDKKVDN